MIDRLSAVPNGKRKTGNSIWVMIVDLIPKYEKAGLRHNSFIRVEIRV